jgi:hypothetical protein
LGCDADFCLSNFSKPTSCLCQISFKTILPVVFTGSKKAIYSWGDRWRRCGGTGGGKRDLKLAGWALPDWKPSGEPECVGRQAAIITWQAARAGQQAGSFFFKQNAGFDKLANGIKS